MNCLEKNCTDAKDSGSLVYLTKVFFEGSENASPLLTNLVAGPEAFTSQLTIGGNKDSCCCCCSCDGCNDFEITPTTTFDIDKAYVLTKSFAMTDPYLPYSLAVTVDGIPITGITQKGRRFIGDISGIMAEIAKCPCRSSSATTCPGNFIMVSAAGPWSLSAVIVVEGTAFDCGKSCPFKLCFTTDVNMPISVCGDASFAFCGVDIPCQVSDISPELIFDFDACATILNPVLTPRSCCEICLNACLVVTPEIRMQITRPSLFSIDADEVFVPCDDLGQCSPCNPAESSCMNNGDNDCCCGNPAKNMVTKIIRESSDHRNRVERQGECCDSIGEIACQCCDTNGYRF